MQLFLFVKCTRLPIHVKFLPIQLGCMTVCGTKCWVSSMVRKEVGCVSIGEVGRCGGRIWRKLGWGLSLVTLPVVVLHSIPSHSQQSLLSVQESISHIGIIHLFGQLGIQSNKSFSLLLPTPFTTHHFKWNEK